ncbi:hypothetical protein DE146DRAFT_763956 [Phaeosphaeria sp. MPI-PUGE-AT-0046c]|nr:hypothetical protein DE146DRAFT_763956 [Phaeosphaeria sp. MPI-PUGE-AT-0046c]
MKSFFLYLTQVTTTLSILSTSQAVLSNATSGPSCGAPIPDNSFFSVVGVQGCGVQPRLELRDLEKDTELWNMFLMAMVRFQAMDQNQKISYYQIAGIHGVPFKSWDDVQGQENQQKMGYSVACSAAGIDRTLLSLSKSCTIVLWISRMSTPAGSARDGAMETANRVRLPFWDWAIDPPNSDGNMPSSLRRPMVTVTNPDGTKSDIRNPLYRYDFHPLKSDDFSVLSEFQFKNWNHTIRDPENAFVANATSRNDEVNKRLGKQQPNLRNMLYKLLTTYQPFNQVSNKANGGSIGNFETLHDGLHTAFGIGSNMGIVEASAFDPIFWFHHCNMDRIVAMYQSRYPNTWIEDANQAMGTFTVKQNSTIGVDSPLTPFHMNADGDMWTSSYVRNWTSFGYTYPELIGNPSNETLTSSMNKLYKPRTQGLNDTDPTIPAPGGNSTNITTQATDWQCEVNMPSDIRISYSVRAFLGVPNADPKKWATDDNYIGQLASLSSSRMKTGVIVSGSIGLSEKLAQKHQAGELKSLSKADVAAYLKENFHWRIQAQDLTEIPRDTPPKGLNVTVYNVPLSVPESDTEVPTRSGKVEYNDDIDGNPPVYNGPGIGGTNSTAPAGQVGGSYNSTTGEFEWRVGHGTEDFQPPAPVLPSVPIVPSVPVAPSPVVPSSVPSVPKVSGAVTTITSAAAAPDTTEPPRGPETRYVTEIVVITR